LTFETELLDFRDKPKEKWEMTDKERELDSTNQKARFRMGMGYLM
jgi:hypothetical protein